MKKSPILILTLSALLASCGAVDPATSSSSKIDPASSSSDVSSSSSDSSSSSSDSSSSSTAPVTIESITAACETAVKNSHKVASGSVTKTTKYEWSEDSDTLTDTFEYGTDKFGTIFHSTTEISGDFGSEAWVVHDDEGSLVSVSKNSSGTYSQPFTVYENAGYYFSGYMGYSTSYGTEDLLQELVGFANVNKNKDLVVGGEDGTYNFSYIYYTNLDAWVVWKVNASFTVDSDGVLTDLNASFVSYANNNFTIDDENETITLNSDATYTMSAVYAVTQTKGTPSYKAPFNLSDFYFTSFNFKDSKDNIYDDGDTLSFAEGESVVLNAANMVPSTGSFSFDALKVSIVDGDADEISAYAYSGALNVSSSTAGTYKIKIESKNCTKTLTIEVTKAVPTGFSYVGYYSQSPDGLIDGSFKDDAMTAYVGSKYYFSTSIEPYAADQSITASIVGTVADEDYTLEEESVYVNTWDDEATDLWAFTPKKAGDYQVKLTSTENANVTKTVTVHAVVAPTVKDFLSSTFGYRDDSGEVKYILDFVPSEDGMSGTLTIQDKVNSKSEVASYSLTAAINCYSFRFTHVSGDTIIDDEDEPLSIVLGCDWKLYFADDWGSYNPISVADPQFYIAQKWQGKSGNFNLTVNITKGGYATFDFEDTVNYEDYFYFQANWALTKNSDGTCTVTLTENSDWGSLPDSCPFTLPYTLTVSADFTTMTATAFTYKNVEYAFSLSFSASGDFD